MSAPTIYTIDQVAEVLQVHRKTVERLIHSGALGYKKIGRGYRISEKALNVFMDSDGYGVTVPMSSDALRRLRA